jgi:caffeoylshikimate esterase
MYKIVANVTPASPLRHILISITHIFPRQKLVPQKDLAELAFREVNKRKMVSYNVIVYKYWPRLRTTLEMLRTPLEIEKRLQEVSFPLLILHEAIDIVIDPYVTKAPYEKSKRVEKQMKNL